MSQDNSALGFTVFEAEEAEVTLGHLIAFLFTFSLIPGTIFVHPFLFHTITFLYVVRLSPNWFHRIPQSTAVIFYSTLFGLSLAVSEI